MAQQFRTIRQTSDTPNFLQDEPWEGIDDAEGLYRYKLTFLIANGRSMREVFYEEARLRDNLDRLIEWRGDARLRSPMEGMLAVEKKFGEARVKRYMENAELSGSFNDDATPEDEDYVVTDEESDGGDPEVHAAMLAVIRSTFKSLHSIMEEPIHSSGWARLN